MNRFRKASFLIIVAEFLIILLLNVIYFTNIRETERFYLVETERVVRILESDESIRNNPNKIDLSQFNNIKRVSVFDSSEICNYDYRVEEVEGTLYRIEYQVEENKNTYIMMNIGGVRPGVEDLSEMGHEFREGFAMGDDIDNNPWEPLHVDFGFDETDSTVTMFWPQEHRVSTCTTVPAVLKALCKMDPYGWDPGLAVILTPKCAKMMADAGWTKQRILEYIVEYARKPAKDVDLQWLIQNNHPPKTVDLPLDMEASTRTFWSSEHMFLTVAGGQAGCMVTVLGGGGDHGGPSCAKIELPEDWETLVAQYQCGKPAYVAY